MHIDHITIRTSKLEGSIDFYEKIAGLRIVRDLRKVGSQIVFLADADGDTRIELIEVPEGKGYCGSGISEIISPNPSVRFFFTADPNGVQIQFVEQ